MFYAIKANRQYKISEDEKQKYRNMGYKIAELKNDKLVFEEIETEETKEIAKLKKENEKLKKELDALKKDGKEKGEGK
ncbi:hypothetical protein [Clostridium sp. Cult3]|uniref:hypothetical protein n=1 Tax=Clostridium sp. Cult3 TaxID=2079004 RepID=UPI001F2BB33D|nr:hypothetical protein [Clostridium sp. Cult3]MCF6461492.1 hypothetical protein [Clostridium sp. Cult3]